ncbi:DUF1127 domain-containing protein [Inquilinus sp. CA228]|uniref:DUF1127 domain-containing protein n=1 Tax=Inquilinus sp. CA228 TaxID=3455609 RepID=UPI003F8D45F7
MPPRAPANREALGAVHPPSVGRSRWLSVLTDQRRPLHRLSDHLLRDIGLSRADLQPGFRNRFRPD